MTAGIYGDTGSTGGWRSLPELQMECTVPQDILDGIKAAVHLKWRQQPEDFQIMTCISQKTSYRDD